MVLSFATGGIRHDSAKLPSFEKEEELKYKSRKKFTS
jgi:hypothetical protein